ncbi:amidohydrolase family protein [Pseudodesulfovibrio sp. zrk46]|uniref:amidohydrolase family protein n=1 Tax=Pseudodesulfovibrio sp. zrk46 TaxID=2725288 RepID=UPI00144A035C|nr:amidohydrolase family protein [Pseudodesulfovibrio sp. zrk46]QJB57406.1 amidohydrolase family protein [Pseudodesulfovibrio sp. zrk46]
MKQYAFIIKNGFLVDPANDRKGIYDIAVDQDGFIAEIGKTITANALEIIDAEGLIVAPGIIDCHMHASSAYGGPLAHRMLAKAGVVTAVDLGGPIDDTLSIAHDYGCGLNMAFLQTVKPGETIRNTNPQRDEIEKLLDNTLNAGGIGFKVLGGHFPLTPEGTETVFTTAHEHGAYMAFHAGTLATGSNLDGLKEAAELASGKRLHLAHINSYCRGNILPAEEEAEEALRILEQNPNIQSESYLARINGLSGRCTGGKPESTGTQAALAIRGYEQSTQGMRDAIKDGWCQVNAPIGGTIIQLDAQSGLEFWEERHQLKQSVAVSFAINPPATRIRLASAKGKNGAFIINAISTDGGGIPRNDQVEKGLALVRAEVFNIQEYIHKVSTAPAQMLGLSNKGHLAEGADADISILCLNTLQPKMTLGKGRIIMQDGVIHGHGTTVLTTDKGQQQLRAKGFNKIQTTDLSEKPFLRTLSD